MSDDREAFEKITKPGNVDRGRLFVTIKWDGKRLSLTGVEGPLSNGDARGGCGQTGIKLSELRLDDGYTSEMARQLAEIWDRWHLNDMRAGCEHQREMGWGGDVVEFVTYKLTPETFVARNRIESYSRKRLKAGESVKLSDEETALLNLPWTTHTPPDADSSGSGCYEVEKREQKGTGWLRPEEHPLGVLCKACPECGYKYGSGLYEEVPTEVLSFLRSLPDNSDEIPYSWRT